MIVGIQSGMVMQRGDDGTCHVFFSCNEAVETVSCDCAYYKPQIERKSGKYLLTGISAGGPYTLKINQMTFHDIYVGDVWLLCGQSNMQGVGRMVDIPFNANDGIRAYYMNGHWGVANHPLHELGFAKHGVHRKLGAQPSVANIRGVGPGLAFAQKMYGLTHVPQGLICCAHGGTNLFDQWSPDGLSKGPDHSLYAAMHARYIENGGNVKGVFWYQGCSDTKPEVCEEYTENMIHFVGAVRTDLQPDLPFVQVQISRVSWASPENMQEHCMWQSIREQQRLLNKRIEKLDTVSTIAYRLEDCIHLQSAAQAVLGEDAAESMFCLLHGKCYGCLPGIRLQSMEIVEDDFDAAMCSIILTYDNVHGKLDGGVRPMGFDRSNKPDFPEQCGIFDTFVDGNRVILRCDYAKKDLLGQYLWYGFGKNPSCNIVDERGRSLPAFGPLPIRDGIVDM